jgi:hypothetical protein
METTVCSSRNNKYTSQQCAFIKSVVVSKGLISLSSTGRQSWIIITRWRLPRCPRRRVPASAAATIPIPIQDYFLPRTIATLATTTSTTTACWTGYSRRLKLLYRMWCWAAARLERCAWARGGTCQWRANDYIHSLIITTQ